MAGVKLEEKTEVRVPATLSCFLKFAALGIPEVEIKGQQ
jgi:hypothetical protein